MTASAINPVHNEKGKNKRHLLRKQELHQFFMRKLQKLLHADDVGGVVLLL